MRSKVELPKITDSEENKSIFIFFQVAEIAASKGWKNMFVLMEVTYFWSQRLSESE